MSENLWGKIKFFIQKITICSTVSLYIVSSAICGIVRDAETEHALSLFNDPLLKAMNFEMPIVSRIILQDTFNAFVTGKDTIYYMAGLLLGVDNVEQLIAVSAHELAHLKAKHVDSLALAQRRAKLLSLSTLAIGALGTVASKNMEGMIGSIALSNQVVFRQYLQESRSLETVADSIAVDTLKKAGLSPVGQVQIQKKFLDRNGLMQEQDTYNQTHPSSHQRLTLAQKALAESPYKNVAYPQKWKKLFLRIRAKLFGFMKQKSVVFAKYPVKNTSDNARYARAMFYYANNRPKQGIQEMEALLRKYPKDLYYRELYASLLANAGHVDKAILYQKNILTLYPTSGLLWMEYANILLKKGTKKALKDAEYALFRAKIYEPKERYLYRLMTVYYSKTKQEGKRLLARAETELLNKSTQAKVLAQQAKRILSNNSAEYKRANDIIRLSKDI